GSHSVRQHGARQQHHHSHSTISSKCGERRGADAVPTYPITHPLFALAPSLWVFQSEGLPVFPPGG
ncbi:hypothetical protein F7725_027563, partial [Dissostichus mawsoni]